MSLRIGRGFYEDGIWADSVFIPYNEVGGISWREGEHEVTLVVISRLRNLARRLKVPGDKYGEARRLPTRWEHHLSCCVACSKARRRMPACWRDRATRRGS